MRPIVMDGLPWSVYRSVCHDRDPCKTAEPIEMPFDVQTRKHVSAVDAHWCNLANTIELSMCGGLLSNIFDHLFSQVGPKKRWISRPKLHGFVKGMNNVGVG